MAEKNNSLMNLLQNNRNWSNQISQENPSFFNGLAAQQTPQYMWIGCADSRVPANELIGLLPGEVFVHRNVANIIAHSDLNCLSATQYAVEVLQVKHIIVCGHYGCGGVKAVLHNHRVGLVDNWLRHIHDIKHKYVNLLRNAPDDEWRLDRLCEFNVLEQAVNVCQTTVLQDAWQRGQTISVHSWIYNLRDGLLRPLGLDVGHIDELVSQYENVIKRMGG